MPLRLHGARVDSNTLDRATQPSQSLVVDVLVQLEGGPVPVPDVGVPRRLQQLRAHHVRYKGK